MKHRIPIVSCVNWEIFKYNFFQLLIKNGATTKKKLSNESLANVSLYTTIKTYLIFYILHFLGYFNQLLFSHKFGTEKQKEVCLIMYSYIIR